jgi:hypothetical protein
MSTYLKDALLKQANDKEDKDEDSDFLKRTYKGSALGAAAGGALGTAFTTGAGVGGDIGKENLKWAALGGGLVGAGAGAALGAVAPHFAIGLMALAKKGKKKLEKSAEDEAPKTEEPKDDFWERTKRGMATGAMLGGLGGAGLYGAHAAGNLTSVGAPLGAQMYVVPAAGLAGGLVGAAGGAMLGGLAPHFAVGLMALAKSRGR